MSDLIKYHNDMNKVSFNGFNEKELNLFFSLCFKAKNIGTNEVSLSFSELRKLSRGDINLSRFLKTLKTTYDKLITLPFHYKNEKGFGAFILFNKYFVNEIDKTVTIKLSEDFEYILNNLIGNFTKFDLIEFVSLKSSYSKNIFKILKQWESKKEKTFLIEEFREVLNIPIKYRISEIDKFVLKPIIIELPQYFNNLKVEKIKTGRKVTHLKFSWMNKKVELKKIEDIEILVSSKLKDTIDKAKKNRFIFPFLTDDNIESLVNDYEEKDLIKGLNWAYKKIKNEIHSFNYLRKSISTGIEQPNKRIIEKTLVEKKFKEPHILAKSTQSFIEKNLNEEIFIQAIEITRNDYEVLYKQYLKNNNIEHNNFVRRGFDISNQNKYKIIEPQTITTEEYELLYLEYLKENKLENTMDNRRAYDTLTEHKYILTLTEEEDRKEKDLDDDHKPPMYYEECCEKTKRTMLREKINYKNNQENLKFIEKYVNLIDEYIEEESLKIAELESNVITRLKNKFIINSRKEELKLFKDYSYLLQEWTWRYLSARQCSSMIIQDEIIHSRGIKILDIVEILNIVVKEKNEDMLITKETIEKWIIEVTHNNEFSTYSKVSIEDIKNILHFEDIPKEKLLSKKGKKLSGMALIERLKKLAKEYGQQIQYKDVLI